MLLLFLYSIVAGDDFGDEEDDDDDDDVYERYCSVSECVYV